MGIIKRAQKITSVNKDVEIWTLAHITPGMYVKLCRWQYVRMEWKVTQML